MWQTSRYLLFLFNFYQREIIFLRRLYGQQMTIRSSLIFFMYDLPSNILSFSDEKIPHILALDYMYSVIPQYRALHFKKIDIVLKKMPTTIQSAPLNEILKTEKL